MAEGTRLCTLPLWVVYDITMLQTLRNMRLPGNL